MQKRLASDAHEIVAWEKCRKYRPFWHWRRAPTRRSEGGAKSSGGVKAKGRTSAMRPLLFFWFLWKIKCNLAME